MPNSPFSEYPKWVRHNGLEALVADAEAEELQLAEWAALPAEKPSNKLVSVAAFDHDGDGRPGGSTKPDGDVADLRRAYQDKFGKRPFPGWKADELKARIEAA